MIKHLVAAASALVAFTAQANQVSGFTESYSDTVKVSGQLLKGLQYADVDFELTPRVYFPKPYSGTICVAVSSADGRYKSQYQYTFSDTVQGLVPIEFPSQYIDELNSFTADELGILVSVQDDCMQTQGHYLISAWGEPENRETISLFIRSNARRDIAEPLSGASQSEGRVKCQDLNSQYRVSYDKECVIGPISVDNLHQIRITRRNLRAMPDELIELYR